MSLYRFALQALFGGLVSTLFISATQAQPATVQPVAAPVTATAPVTAPALTPGSFGKKLTTWDAMLETGYGYQFGNNSRSLWLGRAGVGILAVRDPNFYSLDLTYEYSTFSSASLGVQAEAMRLDSGLWAVLGVCSDLDYGARPGASLSLGWSLFAVEADVRSREGGAATALFGKLRVPLGVVGWALSRH